MNLLLGLVILAILLFPLVIAIRRSTELFCLRVDDGAVRHLRGKIPPRLLEDIRDVAQRPKLFRVELRVITENGNPRLVTRGDIDRDQLQQLRNVVGSYSTARIRAGRRRP